MSGLWRVESGSWVSVHWIPRLPFDISMYSAFGYHHVLNVMMRASLGSLNIVRKRVSNVQYVF